MSRTSAATTPPSDSFTTSPGTSSAAGMVFHAPSRRTDAFSASRDFSAARVAWARLSWNSPSAALNTSRPAMIAASTYLPSTSSSTIAASSIHGTGAQNFSSAMRNGCSARIGHRVRAELRQPAARLVARQAARQASLCGSVRSGGRGLARGGGVVVTKINLTLGNSQLHDRRRPSLPLYLSWG